MTTETTKFDVLTADSYDLEREYAREVRWGGLPSWVRDEAVRAAVAADREKRTSELTDAMIAREWDNCSVEKVAGEIRDFWMDTPLTGKMSVLAFARRIFALARPSDASAVDDGEGPVYSEDDVATVAQVISLFRIAQERGATFPSRPTTPLAGRVFDTLMAAKTLRGRDEERVKREAAHEALRRVESALLCAYGPLGAPSMLAVRDTIRDEVKRIHPPLPSPRCVLSTGEVWEKVSGEHPYRVTVGGNGAAAYRSVASVHRRIGELSVAGLTEDVAKLVAFAKEGK